MPPLATLLFILFIATMFARVAAEFHKGACCGHDEFVAGHQIECSCGNRIEALVEDIE